MLIGLSDIADALGAAHRDPARCLDVLKDPHTGASGVVVIVIAIVAKLVLLARVDPWAIALICAWARLGPLAWTVWLPPLAAGRGERFRWHIRPHHVAVWAVALLAASAWLAPALLIAPLVLAAYDSGSSGDWAG